MLDEAHERVEQSQQIEHALAQQMHFTALTLLSATRHGGAHPAGEQPLQQHPGPAGGRGHARRARADPADPGRPGRGHERGGRHRQRHPRRPARRGSGRAPWPRGSRVSGDRGAGSASWSSASRPACGLQRPVEAGNRRSLVMAAYFAAAHRPGPALRLRHLVVVHPARAGGRHLPGPGHRRRLGSTITVPNRDEFGDLAGE